ncbi:GerMN domain-containing protein [Geodermatophilus sp. SYSU D00700]
MRRARPFIGAVLLAGLAGCGVPMGAPAEAIPGSEVPAGLSSPAATSAPMPTSTPPPAPVADPARVYLLGADDALVPRARAVTGSTRENRLERLLDDLADGPTALEQDQQLSTALPPDVELSVADVAGGTATVDISGTTDAPSGWASRLAVAQLVLTATSVPGVDDVLLTIDGQPVEAPLPSGALTTEALTPADYAPLLSPGESPPS